MKEIISNNFDSVIFVTLIAVLFTAFLGFISINNHHQQVMADKGYIEQPVLGSTNTIWVKDNGCY